MSFVALYLLTFAIFLVIDYFGLTYLIRPIFERDAGHLLRESLRFGPALAFYAFYIVGVLYFVSAPALAGDWSAARIFLTATLLGALAYGTYEFTNLATLKGWSWSMVAADLSWGALLTGGSAYAGVAAFRLLT